MPWSTEPSCPTLLRAAAQEFSLGSSPHFHPLAPAHSFQLKTYSFVLSRLSRGAVTHSTQLLETLHQTSRDWRGWEKRCYNFILHFSCRQWPKPGHFQKLALGKGGFLQGNIFVSREGIYVNWAASNWTGGTARSRDEHGSLLRSSSSSPLRCHLLCWREDKKQAWPVSAFWSLRLCCLTMRPVKGERQGEPRTITAHLL